MSKEIIVSFDSNDKDFKKKYGDTFEFVEPFLLDEDGKGCARVLETTVEEMIEAGFKITPKKVQVPPNVPIRIVSMQGPNMGLPQVELNGIRFDLICFPDEPNPIKVRFYK